MKKHPKETLEAYRARMLERKKSEPVYAAIFALLSILAGHAHASAGSEIVAPIKTMLLLLTITSIVLSLVATWRTVVAHRRLSSLN